MANENEFKEYLEKEFKRLEEIRKQKFEEKDFKPWLRLEVGETTVEFLPKVPRDHPVWNDRKIFRVKVNGEEYDFSVSTNSKLYREIITNLARGYNILSIIRVGTTKEDTRYTVKPIREDEEK